MKPVTIDFETDGIEGRPNYPPKPIGVSIKYAGRKPKYYAFDHISNNNTTFEKTEVALRKAWGHEGGLLFQNGKFDLDVAETFFDIILPPWHKVDDTLFKIFLNNPHQKELGLKPSSEILLGMPPDEKDELEDWMLAHQPVPNIKVSKSKKSPNYFMKYLRWAPGDLVGKYCNGDVIRTEKINNKLTPYIDKEMRKAYDRERQLMPILLNMERTGVPVDLKRLQDDVDHYLLRCADIDEWLFSKLGTKEINLDSGAELVDTMIFANLIDPNRLPLTAKTKKYQTNKEALHASIDDPILLAILQYRSQLNTCLRTFMQPWAKTAEASGGLIYTSWNQVRNPDDRGTRTGRFSSTPNFQNIPREFDETEVMKELQRIFGGPLMPTVRSYIIPFSGDTFIVRDYSQQELRILAHFEGSVMLQKYLDDPWIDIHQDASEELKKYGLYYPRKIVKNFNFGIIYGMGNGLLAKKSGIDYNEAVQVKAAIYRMYPGLRTMYAEMKQRAKNHDPIHTWGGRVYYCEEPVRLPNGRVQEFDYKMVNVLIQGSAADCTKESIIQFHKGNDNSWKYMLSVHDEGGVSAPSKQWIDAMQHLKETMENIDFDVKMLSEGSYSFTNWGSIIDYDKKGKLCRLSKKNRK